MKIIQINVSKIKSWKVFAMLPVTALINLPGWPIFSIFPLVSSLQKLYC